MQKVRKVTVVQNSSPWALAGSQTEGHSNLNTLVLDHHEVEEENSNCERKTSEEFFSQDSLEPGAGQNDQRRRRRSRALLSSSSYSSSTEEEEEEDTDKEALTVHPATRERAEVQQLTSLLNFGDDYRKYIDSLSDSSCSVERDRGSRRLKKRST